MPTEKRTVALEHASACFLWVTMQSIKHNAPSNVHYRLGCVKAQTFGTRVSGMRTSAKGVKKTELLILDSKKLRQAGIRRLLDIWAEAMGLTVKAVVPDAPLDTCCTPDNCEMTIISLGGASIEDAQHQATIGMVRTRMPQTLLVIISDRDDPKEICAAFENGASGFMPTSLEPALAFQALSFIRSGGSFFPPSVLFSGLGKVTVNGASDLTTKQENVFSLLRQGYPNKKIARQLGLSEATVKVHVRRIMHKFGAANRTELAIAAMNANTGEGGNGNSAQGC
jgi:DNA-binding NarL/FixJ family response regulator